MAQPRGGVQTESDGRNGEGDGEEERDRGREDKQGEVQDFTEVSQTADKRACK